MTTYLADKAEDLSVEGALCSIHLPAHGPQWRGPPRARAPVPRNDRLVRSGVPRLPVGRSRRHRVRQGRPVPRRLTPRHNPPTDPSALAEEKAHGHQQRTCRRAGSDTGRHILPDRSIRTRRPECDEVRSPSRSHLRARPGDRLLPAIDRSISPVHRREPLIQGPTSTPPPSRPAAPSRRSLPRRPADPLPAPRQPPIPAKVQHPETPQSSSPATSTLLAFEARRRLRPGEMT
jgi:hypothetical protein